MSASRGGTLGIAIGLALFFLICICLFLEMRCRKKQKAPLVSPPPAPVKVVVAPVPLPPTLVDPYARNKEAVEWIERQQPMIGIRFEEYPGDGIKVLSVPPELPGYQSGVRPKDIIMAVNGVIVGTKKDFMERVHGAYVGDVMQISIVRDANDLVLPLVVGCKESTLSEVKEKRALADALPDANWKARAQSIDGFDGDMLKNKNGKKVDY